MVRWWRRSWRIREVPMTAAYDSVSLNSADLVLDDEDGASSVPAAPVSGIKSLIVESSTRPISADRNRAFRALYEAHVAFVWRNLRRLGVSDADVEDKVQEVF